MQQSTKTEQRELLHSQNNVEETHRQKSTLIDRDKVPGTPFWIVGTDEGWFLTMGDYKVTTPVESKSIALDKLKTEKWDIIMRMAAIITEKTIDEHGKTLKELMEIPQG